MSAVTIFGYPLKAMVEVDGAEVDVTAAFVFDPAASVLRLEPGKVLDLIAARRLAA